MCGRFTISFVIGLSERFQARNPSFELIPRYNIAPSQDVPVVVRAHPDDAVNEIRMMRWGLVPSWVKDPSRSPKPINARADTLNEKPMFRNLLQTKRCLIPATGFYEWKKEVWGRTPYYIRMRDNSLFAFAGLFDTYRAPDSGKISTFSIITTEPNAVVSPYHDRMPAILKGEDEERWLGSGVLCRDELSALLHPYPASGMEAYAVGKKVNNPDAEGQDLILPVPSLTNQSWDRKERG
ncbi:MAG TPA: SOS response-associated peptidase [Methanoregulaceae archaeon]|nr:SOS response-associated peptidase [Methanoregulaceae archaeon]